MTRKPRRRATDRVAPRTTKSRTRLHLSTEGSARTRAPAAPAPSATPRAVLRSRAESAAVWRARRPKLLAAAVVIALAAALAAFFITDQFYVYTIQVNGIEFLTQSEVERATGLVGYNIFFVEPAAAERALSRLPEVKTARVTTAVPNHLSIEIQERVPEMTWLRGSETYWVDADGVAFRARATLPELPTVRDLDQQPVKTGQALATDGRLAAQALRSAWRDAPRALEWSAARGLSFVDERGWKIYLGNAVEMAGKLTKYRALAAQLVATNAKIKFIDLGKGDPYYQ